MDAINEPQIERDVLRMQTGREELVERILQALPQDGAAQPLEGLHLFRSSTPLAPVHSVVRPCLCVIAQGSKEVLLGDSRYVYDPFHYLISTVELPRTSQVLEASPERPYLSLRLDLTPALVGAVMSAAHVPAAPANPAKTRAMNVSPLDGNLQDAVLRLVRLLQTPAEAPVLLPLIQREIVFRLLTGEQAARLYHLASGGSYTPLITRAVERLRQCYDQPLRMETLAHELGISVSGLHHHFKAITAMSPLQYQKQLRLQEARRLMLSENLDAASAAFRVGYNDASHFNREYKSLFGCPPMRDVQRLREMTTAPAD
jgi:AraC-like DNA-binding protein